MQDDDLTDQSHLLIRFEFREVCGIKVYIDEMRGRYKHNLTCILPCTLSDVALEATLTEESSSAMRFSGLLLSFFTFWP